MHRKQLLDLLKQHKTQFMDEAAFVSRAIYFIEEHEDCFDRELWPIHVTGSTWVVNSRRDRVLLLHHRKLDQWFQPGGHADGDADILRVALKETAEETGLEERYIKLVNEAVFDVDIHRIDANYQDPQHEHIDIRFLIEIDDAVLVPGNDESHQVLWVNLYQVTRYNNNRSTYRMLQKTRQLRNMLAA
jgi:8-oxo-dGTP pyrophosphatase MutT (NUDIX family)